jgi:HPt (histidine-containing phosphotransfer) domain-containing protein
MQWLCSNFPEVELTIVRNFEKAQVFLEEHGVDLIFTDRRIGNQSFHEFPQLWFYAPYYVVSNTIFKEKNLELEPKDYLQKPLVKSTLASIFSPKPKVDLPKMDYFEQLPSSEMATEMIQLLIEELEKGEKTIPTILNNENNLLSRTVHNLAGKFSLLGMEKTFYLCREIESLLENGKVVTTLVQDLQDSISESLKFLKQQNTQTK